MTSHNIPSTAAPVPPQGLRSRIRAFGRPPRLMGVDVARGIAVIGMIGAHVGMTESFDWTRIETWTDLVHGRSSILFAIVAGISLALLSRSTDFADEGQVRVLRLKMAGRGAAILAIGLLLELLNTGVAVILPLYGIVFIAVIPFLGLSRRTLALIAAALAVGGPIALQLAATLSLHAFGPGLDLVLFGIYPITVWLCLMLAGLAIGRLDLRRTRVAATLILGGAALAAIGYGLGALIDSTGGSGSTSSVVGTYVPLAESSVVSPDLTGADPGEIDFSGLVCDDDDGWVNCYPAEAIASSESGSESEDTGLPNYFSQLGEPGVWDAFWPNVLAVDPHSGGVLEIVGSGGFGVAVIGACLLLARPLRWVLVPVASLGSMPLTAYAAHIVVILFAMGGVGMTSDNTLWLLMSLGLLIACTSWALLIGRGPLERLVARAANAMAGVTAR